MPEWLFMKKSLVALAVGTFSLGISEFGMMGILSDVASGVGVDIATAGHLVSAYSLGVAVGAPMLIAMRRLPLKRLMLLLSAVIAIGNAVAAAAPGFYTLVCARFISGLPHGAFFGAGAIVCSRLADNGHGAKAVAVMIGGMAIANVAGVPAATFISNIFSWRAAFAIVMIFSVLTFAGLKVWMPFLEVSPDNGVKGQFRFLRGTAPWLIYGGVFFGQAGVYCWLSYIEPIMTGVTGFSPADMTWVMMLVGLGMVVGNALSGRLADRYHASLVCGFIAVAMVVVMPLIYFCSGYKVPSLVLSFLAAAAMFGNGGPLQNNIVRFAKGGEMLGGAGIQIAFNVSNAFSAAIGGAAINHGLGIASPALIGGPFAIVGAIMLFMLYRDYGTRGA